MRAEIDAATVDEYAAHMVDGDRFPPVIVFHDGTDHWLADGFHRVAATEKAGGPDESIDADIRSGTLRDAIRYAITSNAKHGKRRSNADKRIAVIAALRDDEWSTWSSRVIASAVGVSHQFVENVRAEVSTVDTCDEPPRSGADGKSYPAKNGKSKRDPRAHAKTDRPAPKTAEPSRSTHREPDEQPTMTLAVEVGACDPEDTLDTVETLIADAIERFDFNGLLRLQEGLRMFEKRVAAAAKRISK